MENNAANYVNTFMAALEAKNPGEHEFHQAVREVLESVAPYLMESPHLMKAKIMERMVEPERVVMFRVPWVDDKGEVHLCHQRIKLLHVVFLNARAIALSMTVLACQTACDMLVRYIDELHLMTCCFGCVLKLFRHPSGVAIRSR